MQVRVQENPDDFGACGCGRSPNGKCIGWHGLSQEQYLDQLTKYEAQLFDVADSDQAQKKNS
jgi:hypothetical protein